MKIKVWWMRGDDMFEADDQQFIQEKVLAPDKVAKLSEGFCPIQGETETIHLPNGKTEERKTEPIKLKIRPDGWAECEFGECWKLEIT